MHEVYNPCEAAGGSVTSMLFTLSVSQFVADHDPRVGPGITLKAHFEMGGIRGEFALHQPEPGAPVTYTFDVTGLEQYESQAISEYNILSNPVQFVEYPDFPCANLGLVMGPPDVCTAMNPEQTAKECPGRIGFRNAAPLNTSRGAGPLTVTDTGEGALDLYGPYSPLGRPIVIGTSARTQSPIACANIGYQGTSLFTLRAGFSDTLQGDVILRRQNGLPGATIRVQLGASCTATLVSPLPPLDWYLRSGTCDDPGSVSEAHTMPISVLTTVSLSLQVYGNDTHPDDIHHGAFAQCSRERPLDCPIGDLTTKCGQVTASSFSITESMLKYSAFCYDKQLGHLSESQLQETVLVFHDSTTGAIVDCQPWNPINQLCARANCMKRPRINIDVLFFQSDPNDPTYIRSHITGLDQQKGYLQVRRDPVGDKDEDQDCEAGGIFDKPRSGLQHGLHVSSPPTGDILPVGVLEHKFTSPRGRESLVEQGKTSWLPLFGPHSIIGRSLVLTDENGVPVACCDIEPVTDPSPELINSILGYQEQSNRPVGK